jgi:hypothetical protein
MSRSLPLPGRCNRPFLSVLLIVSLLLAVLIAPAKPTRAAGVIYVVPGGAGSRNGADWANGKDLQDALMNAVNGEQLWVKADVYKPTSGSDRSATFQLKSGVAVYGGFAGTETALGQRDPAVNITELSGDLVGDDSGLVMVDNPTRSDNSFHVVTGSGTASTAILDGCTITGGNANGSYLDLVGGGLFVDMGNPTIAHVLFRGNSANYGGGMYFNGGTPTVSHATFYNNAASYGGGMFINSSSPTISHVILAGNSASQNGAGIFNDFSTLTISHVTLSGNRAIQSGGGIYNNSSTPTISHATFNGNSATQGGGMYSSRRSPILSNSIMWGNSNGQIVNDMSEPVVRYSLVQGGYISGTNILDAVPLFADADGADTITGTLDDNLRLQADSPAIDAGNNVFIPPDTTDEDGDGNITEPAPFDLDGKPRVARGIVDMGAYEWQIITSAVPLSPVTYGSAYSHTFTGTASGTFSVTAGALPPGLALTTEGLLSGTLTAAGIYTATVTLSSTLGIDSQTFSIVVSKAPLIIKANNASRAVGSPNPSFSATFSGFVNGDTPTSLDGTLTFTTPATSASAAGAYPIRPGGLSSTNYEIDYLDGVLNVGSRYIYLPLVRHEAR